MHRILSGMECNERLIAHWFAKDDQMESRFCLSNALGDQSISCLVGLRKNKCRLATTMVSGVSDGV